MQPPRSLLVTVGSILLTILAFSEAAQANTSKIDEITIHRTACFGECPAYTLTMRSDGCAHLIGETDFILKGYYTALIDFSEVSEEIDKNRFFELSPQYPRPPAFVTDAPTLSVSVTRGSRTYSVTASGDDFTPPNLIDLARMIDGIAFDADWINDDTGETVSTVHARDVRRSSSRNIITKCKGLRDRPSAATAGSTSARSEAAVLRAVASLEDAVAKTGSSGTVKVYALASESKYVFVRYLLGEGGGDALLVSTTVAGTPKYTVTKAGGGQMSADTLSAFGVPNAIAKHLIAFTLPKGCPSRYRWSVAEARGLVSNTVACIVD